jgi:hypothetical protein
MSATTVYAGLAERLATVPGIKTIQLGEPTAIHEPPALYTVLAFFDRVFAGVRPADNLTAMTYTFQHRLYILWQDNSEATAQLLSFINVIPLAIDADPQLGGRLGRGLAKVTRGDAGFVTVSGVKYLVCDFQSEVLEKAPRSTNI